MEIPTLSDQADAILRAVNPGAYRWEQVRYEDFHPSLQDLVNEDMLLQAQHESRAVRIFLAGIMDRLGALEAVRARRQVRAMMPTVLKLADSANTFTKETDYPEQVATPKGDKSYEAQVNRYFGMGGFELRTKADAVDVPLQEHVYTKDAQVCSMVRPVLNEIEGQYLETARTEQILPCDLARPTSTKVHLNGPTVRVNRMGTLTLTHGIHALLCTETATYVVKLLRDYSDWVATKWLVSYRFDGQKAKIKILNRICAPNNEKNRGLVLPSHPHFHVNDLAPKLVGSGIAIPRWYLNLETAIDDYKGTEDAGFAVLTAEGKFQYQAPVQVTRHVQINATHTTRITIGLGHMELTGEDQTGLMPAMAVIKKGWNLETRWNEYASKADWDALVPHHLVGVSRTNPGSRKDWAGVPRLDRNWADQLLGCLHEVKVDSSYIQPYFEPTEVEVQRRQGNFDPTILAREEDYQPVSPEYHPGGRNEADSPPVTPNSPYAPPGCQMDDDWEWSDDEVPPQYAPGSPSFVGSLPLQPLTPEVTPRGSEEDGEVEMPGLVSSDEDSDSDEAPEDTIRRFLIRQGHRSNVGRIMAHLKLQPACTLEELASNKALLLTMVVKALESVPELSQPPD